MEFDAGTRPFTSFDAPSSQSRRRKERRVCVCVCLFTWVICDIEYIVYICIQTFPLCVLAFRGHLYQALLSCFKDEMDTACVPLMLAVMHFCIVLSCWCEFILSSVSCCHHCCLFMDPCIPMTQFCCFTTYCGNALRSALSNELYVHFS